MHRPAAGNGAWRCRTGVCRALGFHVFRAGRLLASRADEGLADWPEQTMRECLDLPPLLRRAAVEAFDG